MIKDGILLLTDRNKFEKLIQYTQQRTGFTSLLIEKDYFLTILLGIIASNDTPLVFKGGTCLNKCHLGFYRLSEDLDFVINTRNIPGRAARSSLFDNLEQLFTDLFINTIPHLHILKTERFDSSKQYRLLLEYDSIVTKRQTIRFEITYKAPLQLTPVQQSISHFFIDPFNNRAVFEVPSINCMDLEECIAEKIRACKSRKEPAIRDFFDIWYIINIHKFDLSSQKFRNLLSIKLQECKDLVDLENLLPTLKRQIKNELHPTLAKRYPFNLEQTVALVASL